MAPGQRRVGTPDPARGDRRAQPAVGQVGLGDDHEPGGVAVEPVHDTRAAFGARRQRRPPGHQRVHQRVVPVARRGMHHQAGRLVDHGQVLVLEDDGKRDAGGLEGAGRLVVGNPDGHALAAGEEPGGAGGLALDVDGLLRHQTGGLRAGEAKLVGEEPVETLGRADRSATVKPAQLRQPRRTPVRGGGRLPARGRSRGRWRRS